jgi:2-keto-3-deoxy-galactonokinase
VVTAVRTNQGTVNARYSCRGADVRPSVKWRLPEGDTTTKEILVFIRTISRNEITTDWAAGGIGPKVHELKEGPLPAGVVVARNGFGEVGYHLCPAKNDIVTVGVYAVPHTMSLKQGFAPSSVKPELGSSEVPWGGAVAFQH